MKKALSKRQTILFGLVAFFLGIILISAIVYYGKLADKQNFTWDFSGSVEDVEYSVKGIPEITVKGKSYTLSDGYDFNYMIEKGDFIEKHRGSSIYKLTKHQTGSTMVFTNYKSGY